MNKIKTSKGWFKYEHKYIYLGVKRIDKKVALENLKVILDIMKKNCVRITPACGSLLGIIREGDFIDWDEDIDLNVLEEDIEAFKNSLWDLREAGFELFRCERCGHLYSIRRNGEYVDFYIMRKISPEVRTNMGPDFVLDKHLINLMDYDFKGVTIQIPVEYENYLTLMYGDWRTPVQYADFELSKFAIFKKNMWTWIKNLPPYSVRWYMLKNHHQKHLEKFLSKCDKRGVKLNCPLQY